MNPIDDQLNRLFRAARAPGHAMATPPYGLETQALAAWRAGSGSDRTMWDMGLLVRGLVLAIVIMGVSFWPVLTSTTDPFSAYVQLADSTVTSDVAP